MIADVNAAVWLARASAEAGTDIPRHCAIRRLLSALPHKCDDVFVRLAAFSRASLARSLDRSSRVNFHSKGLAFSWYRFWKARMRSSKLKSESKLFGGRTLRCRTEK